MSGLGLADNVQGAVLILIVALIVLIYFVVARAGGFLSASRSRRFRTPYRQFRFKKELGPNIKDVWQQLHAVKGASFRKQRLLSFSEYHTFKIIEDDIIAARRGYRIFAQTSLGEILTLTSPNSDAFHSINSKRVDILIVDQGSWPVAAVEYQGGGYYQGDAAIRDAVKKEALHKAGVRYIEISASDSAEQIRFRVREQLGWKIGAPMNNKNTGT